ncbi:MAG: hypothetical protein JW749_09210 [Sedimentisphaerales bacterium]|nr:hypothetical protein [Sedimentisphaerales bacterium]
MDGRKSGSVRLTFVFTLFFIRFIELEAATYCVDAVAGLDSNPGTVESPWRTLSRAQSVAAGGDVILLKDGNYGQFLDNAAKADWVTYRALEGCSPVLFLKIGDASNSTEKAVYLRFEGLHLTGPQGEYAAALNRVSYVEVSRCEIEMDDIMDVAAAIYYCGHILFSDNDIHHASSALVAYYNFDIAFINNSIHHIANDGISGGNSRWLIEGNRIYDIDNDYAATDWHNDGIEIYEEVVDHDDIRVIGNEIFGGEMQAIMISGTARFTNMMIQNNLIHDIATSSSYVSIKSGEDLILINNTVVSGNTQGSGSVVVRTNNNSVVVKLMCNNIFDNFQVEADTPGENFTTIVEEGISDVQFRIMPRKGLQDDAYNGLMVQVTDVSGGTVEQRQVTDYIGGYSGIIVIDSPLSFQPEPGDEVVVFDLPTSIADDPGNTNQQFRIQGGVNADGYYAGRYIICLARGDVTEAKRIIGYHGDLKIIVVESPFTFVPASTDDFALKRASRVDEHGNNIYGNNPVCLSDRTYGFEPNTFTDAVSVNIASVLRNVREGDYRPKDFPPSAAIDFGRSHPDLDADIVGNKRDEKPDAGCYELIRPPNLSGNGRFDFRDYAVFASWWGDAPCESSGWCDLSDFDRNGSVDEADWTVFAQHWLEWVSYVADLNIDGFINMKDYSILAAYWQNQQCRQLDWCRGGDYDHSGVVDGDDLKILAENWLVSTEESWPDVDGDVDVDFGDFALLANQWNGIGCDSTNYWCMWADIDKSGRIDFYDVAGLASYWLAAWPVN